MILVRKSSMFSLTKRERELCARDIKYNYIPKRRKGLYYSNSILKRKDGTEEMKSIIDVTSRDGKHNRKYVLKSVLDFSNRYPDEFISYSTVATNEANLRNK